MGRFLSSSGWWSFNIGFLFCRRIYRDPYDGILRHAKTAACKENKPTARLEVFGFFLPR